MVRKKYLRKKNRRKKEKKDNRCTLTACIETYFSSGSKKKKYYDDKIFLYYEPNAHYEYDYGFDPYDKHSYHDKDFYYGKDSYTMKYSYGKDSYSQGISHYNKYTINSHPKKGHHRELFSVDVSGKVTLKFDPFDPYHEPAGYWPRDRHKNEDEYYYASDFLMTFDLKGLPRYKKGNVHIVDDHCGHIDPDFVHTFYDHYKKIKTPWSSIQQYSAGKDGTDHQSFWVNDAYDCYEHVGKTVFVELPEKRNYYGCGILRTGNHQCKY